MSLPLNNVPSAPVADWAENEWRLFSGAANVIPARDLVKLDLPTGLPNRSIFGHAEAITDFASADYYVRGHLVLKLSGRPVATLPFGVAKDTGMSMPRSVVRIGSETASDSVLANGITLHPTYNLFKASVPAWVVAPFSLKAECDEIWFGVDDVAAASPYTVTGLRLWLAVFSTAEPAQEVKLTAQPVETSAGDRPTVRPESIPGSEAFILRNWGRRTR